MFFLGMVQKVWHFIYNLRYADFFHIIQVFGGGNMEGRQENKNCQTNWFELL